MNTAFEAFEALLGSLDRLEIPYLVAGSVASSFYGLRRYTQDVDLVVAIVLDTADDFAAELGTRQFYADIDMMRRMIRLGRAFNVIHMPTAYKFDIFPLQDDAFSRSQFARRKFAVIEFENQSIECAVASPEDLVLSKLRWYRLGGETSEQQWNDLRGVVQVSGPRLDLDYLNEWAPRLNVADLLLALLGENQR